MVWLVQREPCFKLKKSKASGRKHPLRGGNLALSSLGLLETLQRCRTESRTRPCQTILLAGLASAVIAMGWATSARSFDAIKYESEDSTRIEISALNTLGMRRCRA